MISDISSIGPSTSVQFDKILFITYVNKIGQFVWLSWYVGCFLVKIYCTNYICRFEYITFFGCNQSRSKESVFGNIIFSDNESTTQSLEKFSKLLVIYFISWWAIYSSDSKVAAAVILTFFA